MIRAVPGLCLCKCLLGKYKLKVYCLLLLNPVVGGWVGELPLITVKSCLFHRLKNKRNCQGKLLFCQGNVMEMSENFEWTQMWQP